MKYGNMTMQGQAIILPAITVGNFTRDVSLASGAQAITGLGYKPRAVILVGSLSTGTSTSIGLVAANYGHTDFYDYTDQSETIYSSNAFRVSDSLADYYTAASITLDTDGFTVNWVKAGSPLGTAIINYIAFK